MNEHHEDFGLFKFTKTINLSIARYAFDKGLRTAYEKSKCIHRSAIKILYEGGDIERGHGNVEDVIRIQAEIKPHMYQRGETFKARSRRLREGWFERFAPDDKPGIDIGCQFDALNETFRRWDLLFGDGDAAVMEGVPDKIFHTVYASHVLEHMVDPVLALKNWYRILRPGGHLVISIPHRDLYEKKKELPSNWNPDHKWFWLPDKEESPHTLGLKQVIERAGLVESEIVDLRVVADGYDYELPSDVHSVGEFSIEAVIKRHGL